MFIKQSKHTDFYREEFVMFLHEPKDKIYLMIYIYIAFQLRASFVFILVNFYVLISLWAYLNVFMKD